MPIVDTLETVFVLQDQYSDRARKATQATREFARAQDAVTGIGPGSGGGLAGYFKMAAAELDSATPILQEALGIIKGIGLVATGAGLAFAGFTAYSIQQFAQFEQGTIALRVYAKTGEELERQLMRLREVAQMPGLGFEEAIQGSVRLQAIGFDARLAERALMAFGNALTSAGAGKAELDGVILALSQIVSKGSISAEEINQIAERMPQIREVLKSIYGTADSESLQKMGIGVEQFVQDVIDALEKLPKAAGGAQNSLDNFGDTFNRVIVQYGQAAAAALLPALDSIEKFGSFLERNNVIGDLARDFFGMMDSSSKFADNLRSAADMAGMLGEAVKGPAGFLKGSQDFGDFLVRGASLTVAILRRVPEIFDITMLMVEEQMTRMKDFINGIIEAFNGIIKMLNEGIGVKVGHPLFGQVEIGHVGGKGKGGGIPLLAPIGSVPEGNQPWVTAGDRMGNTMSGVAADAQALYDAFKADNPQSILEGDTSKGSIRGAGAAGAAQENVDATERNTNAIERLTRTQERIIDLNKQLQGGGAFAEAATSELAIARSTRKGTGSGLAPEAVQIAELVQKLAAKMGSEVVATNNRRLRQAGAM